MTWISIIKKYYQKSAYKLFEDKFSLDFMGKKHIELYKRAMNESN
jgi:hypothetical protein